MWSKNRTLSRANSHFTMLQNRLWSWRADNTASRWSRCYFHVRLNTKIWSSSRVLAARLEPVYCFRSNLCRFRSKFAWVLLFKSVFTLDHEFFLRNDKYRQEMKINSKYPTSAIASREVCERMVTEITVLPSSKIAESWFLLVDSVHPRPPSLLVKREWHQGCHRWGNRRWLRVNESLLLQRLRLVAQSRTRGTAFCTFSSSKPICQILDFLLQNIDGSQYALLLLAVQVLHVMDARILCLSNPSISSIRAMSLGIRHFDSP